MFSVWGLVDKTRTLLKCKTLLHKDIHQRVNQSINQSRNQSTNQSIIYSGL